MKRRSIAQVMIRICMGLIRFQRINQSNSMINYHNLINEQSFLILLDLMNFREISIGITILKPLER